MCGNNHFVPSLDGGRVRTVSVRSDLMLQQLVSQPLQSKATPCQALYAHYKYPCTIWAQHLNMKENFTRKL